ncbi:hypothetical protein BDA99DRAFT_542828 [Phascolomyces articulosus]|uniref:Uncharacterized protein n=1 Tax=Phascolomyces articulosus TaxID=60185 RepID=A0AAD5PA23_9FUNG|nr:hypothetical protein BDA99DRAFT_542828 [Phascolomyces articulosus]
MGSQGNRKYCINGFLVTEQSARSLTQLTLSLPYLSQKDVISIFQFCPKLRDLSLHGYPFDITRTIYPYCGKLESLIINTVSSGSDYDIPILEPVSKPSLIVINFSAL